MYNVIHYSLLLIPSFSSFFRCSCYSHKTMVLNAVVKIMSFANAVLYSPSAKVLCPVGKTHYIHFYFNIMELCK